MEDITTRKLNENWQYVLKSIIEQMSKGKIDSLYAGEGIKGENLIGDREHPFACNICIKYGVNDKAYVDYNAHPLYKPFIRKTMVPFSELTSDELKSIYEDVFTRRIVLLKNRYGYGKLNIKIEPTDIVDALAQVGLAPEELLIKVDLAMKENQQQG